MADPLPTVCILAGGLGTRLGESARGKPKALLEVAGEPFIFHQLRLLAANGASTAVVCVGYRGEQVVECVGRERFGIQVSYSEDGPRPLGTLGAIRKAAHLLGERFLVLYGDTYLRLDYRAAARAWLRSEVPAMMTVLRNDGRWGTSNAVFDGARITAYDKWRAQASMRWIDYGLGGLETRTLPAAGPDISDLADLYHQLAREGNLFGFLATERFYEIGTPAALAEASAFLGGRPERLGRTGPHEP